MSDHSMIRGRDDGLVMAWVLTMVVFIGLMVLVGGLTRLTGSGLSMVDWRPITGAMPPITAIEWQQVFELYKKSPQYEQVNFGMSLAEFKRIFYWEYGHRLLGRFLGVLFLVPFVFFLVRRSLSGRQIAGFLSIFCLGGLQGFLGWYMVQSGLVNVPAVSHYRLAAHLMLALLLLVMLFWVYLRFRQYRHLTKVNFLKWGSRIFLVMVCLQIFYGALTAGLKAGYLYNTFPLMNGEWFPSYPGFTDPWWRNTFDNHALVQFIHRVMGTALLLGGLGLWLKGRSRDISVVQRRILNGLPVLLLIQFSLGVATLLLGMPISLASTHQVMALLLLMHATWLVFVFRGRDPA